MKSGSEKSNSQHHFLQKAYLDLFSNDGLIDVIERDSARIRKSVRTTEVAKVKGLYTGVTEDGEANGGLEDAFSIDIEEPGIKIIKNMTCIFPYIPQRRERSLLSSYMALQYLRTPESKRKFQTDYGLFASMELFNLKNDTEKLRQHVLAVEENVTDDLITKYKRDIDDAIQKLEIVPHNNDWLKYIVNGLDVIAKPLHEDYSWHLFIADEPSFITSDHPINLRQISDRFGGVGFKNADEILFALGAKHALVLSRDKSYGDTVSFGAPQEFVKMMNDYSMYGSYVEYYSHPTLTSNLNIQKLGVRGITDVNSPVKIDFIEKYTGVLKRRQPYR